MNAQAKYQGILVIVMRARKTCRKAALCLIMGCILVSCSALKTTRNDPSQSNHPMVSLVEFYQGPLNHLSAVRWGECAMYPSCSEYSRQAFQKYGPVRGWIMTLDRLMRCGRDEIKSAPRIRVDGKWKYYDPLEKNDFSLSSTPMRHH